MARFLTLDVFTTTPFGGNQLAVFPDARGIPEERLLDITREFNFSEVTFCYPAVNPAHTRRVRIFTPGGEVPFAGHPTIGTAAALALSEGALGPEALVDGAGRIVFELGVGNVPVEVRIEEPTRAWAEFAVAKRPEIGPPQPTLATLADILCLDVKDLQGGVMSPQAVSCGYPFLLVVLKSVEALGRARIRMESWERTLQRAWAPEIFLAAKDPSVSPMHWRARMFAPGIRLPEDPATGAAVAAFGGWLGMKEPMPSGSFAWSVEQGVEMGRPSQLEVRIEKEDGKVTAVRVSGHAVLMTEGMLRL